jgi:hypothetical protein
MTSRMQVIYGEKPPNYDAIAKTFNIKGRTNIVFAYGDKLYVPGGKSVNVDTHLLVHEETHANQQAMIGVEKWWERYLEDADFRFLQELEAYRNQYRSMNILPLKHRLDYLNHIATDLAGEMYGNLLSKEDAIRAITDGIILKHPGKSKPGKKHLSERQLKKRARQNKRKGRR